MIKLNGYNNSFATFYSKGEIANNTPVAVSENLTVKADETAAPIFGVCVSCDGEKALVQTHGYVEVPYTSEPTVGYAQLLATKNGVHSDATGRPCFVVSVDQENNTCGIIL